MKTKLLFLLIVSHFAFAQQRTCGMQEQMDRIMADPIARQKHLEMQAKFEVELAKIESNEYRAPMATIYIPVAVHFPSVSPSAAGSLKTCLTTLAQSQIDVLNADYNRTNADYATWTNTASAHFPGVNGGSMDVQFVLATQNHPAGTGLANGTKAVTFGTDYLGTDENDATWRGYMNLVCKYADGYLGWSPLGGAPVNAATVVIDLNAFGSGAGCTGYVPNAPYDLGRTLTHELGHFFNLDHTFAGCTNSNCNIQGDRVCDTPPTNSNTFGCPVVGETVKCSVKTLTMNYMDYTNDACMYMFTAGQSARMLAYYNTISSQFVTNALSNNEFLVKNFSIYPNPNNGSFVINLKEIINSYSIEVSDVSGRVIFEKEFNQNQDLQQNITLNNSQSGLYFVSIKSENAVLTKKIMVK